MTSPWKLTPIAELSKRELLRPQIGVIMGITSDTLHRRIQSMGKLLERRHDGRTHQVFYRLTRDQALVDAFLVTAEPRRIATRAAIDKVRNDPTRHLHILADDEAFVPKMHRGLPRRDSLVAAFFGEGSAT